MKKYLLLASFLLFTAVSVFSQTTMTIESVSASAGAVEIPINVENFNNVGAISIKMNYDTALLTFDGIANEPAGMTANATGGVLSLSWFDMTASSPINISSGKLLDLQFTFAGGGIANVTFIPVETEIADSDGNPIATTLVNGGVSETSTIIGLGLGSLINPDTSAVTIPLNVTNFDNVGAVSIKINYDAGVLTFDSISVAPDPNFTANASGGVLTISWFDLTGSTPLDLGDTLLLNINFTFLGGFTDLTFNTALTEISNADGNPFALSYTNGEVGSIIAVSLPEMPVESTDVDVTIPISVLQFDDVGAISLKIQYNAAALTFQNVTSDHATFAVNSVLGELSISWFDITGNTPISIPEGVLADLHFHYNAGSSGLNFNVAESEIANGIGTPLTIVYTNGTIFYNVTATIDPIADVTANVGDNVAYTLVVNNPNNNGLTWSFESMPDNATFNESTYEFDWTTTGIYAGENNIVYTITDQFGRESSATSKITVMEDTVYTVTEEATGGYLDNPWLFNYLSAAGSVTVEDSTASAWGSYVVNFSDSGYTGLVHPRELWLSNYTVEADVHLIGPPAAEAALYSGLAIRMEGTQFQYYRFVYRNSSSSSHGQLRLQGYDGASWHISKYWNPGVDFTAIETGWNHMKAKIDNGQIQCYINGELLPGGPYVDDDPFLPIGYPGIYVYNGPGGTILFDNFEVNATSVPAQPVKTIAEIQGGVDASPYVDVAVQTSGTVTGIDGNGYYIQDADGAWNGIYVYDYGRDPARGDNVTVTAFVDEYYDKTELLDVAEYALNSSGNPEPNAAVIASADFGEPYEGVLITIENAMVLADLGYGEWQIDDGSGPSVVDDGFYKDFEPDSGDVYTFTGIGDYSYGAYKMQPRDLADIVTIRRHEDYLALDHTPGDLIASAYNNGRLGNGPTVGSGLSWKTVDGLWRGGLTYGTSGAGYANGQTHNYSVGYFDMVNIYSNFTDGFTVEDVNGVIFDQVSTATITDADATTPYGLTVHQKTYSKTGDPVVYVRYGFENTTGTDVADLYSGIFMDFDIGSYTTNGGGVSLSEHLVYEFETGTSAPYFGVAAIDGMDGAMVTPTDIDDLDALRTAVFGYISNIDETDPGDGDQRSWIGTYVGNVAAGETEWVTFALVAGDDLFGVRDNANNAFQLAKVAGWTDINVGVDEAGIIPEEFSITQNYPNPFNPTTQIKFGLPSQSHVKVTVFNLLGEVVTTLVNSDMAAGYHEIQFNASNISSGVYFYSIEASSIDGAKSFLTVKKMMLLK
ncbi:MAG: T9SS type A sorting domain-containing protein [Melioribacteraceae bacterium]|nr:T9SS type A sorting domain-containing protein [Melioribacteraceae bacterium]